MDKWEEECGRRNAAVARDFRVRTLRGCASNTPSTFVMIAGTINAVWLFAVRQLIEIPTILGSSDPSQWQSMCVNSQLCSPKEREILQLLTTFSL